MKKLYLLLLAAVLAVAIACSPADPDQETLVSPTQTDLVFSKVVGLGNSITAGFQSGGWVQGRQNTNFMTIVSQQMGMNGTVVQPLIAEPGIGTIDTQTGAAFGPLKFEGGAIVQGDPIPGGVAGIPGLLFAGGNAELARPYDNLAIPGADVNDLDNSLTSADNGNALYDLVLRNPTFGGTSQVDQAILLQPSMVYLWIGNNDVLGAALGGTTVGTITSQTDFDSRLDGVLNRLQNETNAQIMMVNIPDVTAIPYVNLLNNNASSILIDLGFGPQPVLFDAAGAPINFSPDPTAPPLYLPLLTEETGVQYCLLPFVSQYQATGLGVPDSTALAALNIPEPVIPLILGALQANGINPSGVPVPANLTLTADETTTIQTAVNGFNAKIASAAQSRGLLLVDAFTKFNELVNAGVAGIDGVSAFFVFQDPARTVFSLDGFHPNDAGHAYVAREVIRTLNSTFGLQIPEPAPGSFAGQYLSGVAKNSNMAIEPGVIEGTTKMFIRQRA
ncbi:MAG: hypothetical protein AAFP70_09205, partial [Calditrichota bacterium]